MKHTVIFTFNGKKTSSKIEGIHGSHCESISWLESLGSVNHTEELPSYYKNEKESEYDRELE